MNPSENQNATPPTLSDVVGTPAAALPGRRRLLRAGLMGAPALLALKTSPVLAANCKLPSGFSASGNLSRTGSKNCTAPAPLPSVWRGTILNGTYSGTTISPSNKFKGEGFNVKYFVASDDFATVLTRGNTDIAALTASAFLAAIASGGANFPTSATIKDMWNQGVVGGAYTATTGVVWGEAQVKNYLLYLTGQA